MEYGDIRKVMLFAKDKKVQFSTLEMLLMMKDIAAGMKYIAKKGYACVCSMLRAFIPPMSNVLARLRSPWCRATSSFFANVPVLSTHMLFALLFPQVRAHGFGGKELSLGEKQPHESCRFRINHKDSKEQKLLQTKAACDAFHEVGSP